MNLQNLIVFALVFSFLSANAQQKEAKNAFAAVEFVSQGVVLRGRMYIPDNVTGTDPVIIMAHGFTTTISGMTADTYAERFRDAGFRVLLYDHANLGISDGEPRQEINFWVQARGYLDAIDFIVSQPENKWAKIVVWGASMSSREAFLAGIFDKRVNAVINMIPAFGEEIPAADTDGRFRAFAKATLLSDTIRGLPHTKSEQMPIVSPDQKGTPSALQELTAYRWFIEYGGRFGTNWQNIVSFASVDTPENFNLGQLAPHLKVPILMIVAENDEMHGANPEVTRYIFSTISQPKEWVDIDGGHFGLLYYPSPQFDRASSVQIEFLKRHL